MICAKRKYLYYLYEKHSFVVSTHYTYVGGDLPRITVSTGTIKLLEFLAGSRE